MDTYRKVLLATDFTEHARKAAAEAVRVARRHHAELHVLYVDAVAGQGLGTFTDPPIPDYVRSISQVSSGADLDLGYSNTVLKIVRDASEAAGILRYTKEQGIDLIVVGTHGRNIVSEMVLGSVAQKVVQEASVPVLVVGAHARTHSEGTVLAPVDFSGPCARALARAGQVATERKARLVALHVVDPGRLPYPEEMEPGEVAARARAQLRELVSSSRLPPATEALVTGGPVAEEIIRIANKHQASLIVMAPSGHSGFERLMIGSVCRPVIRTAPCPVLVHREPAKETARQAAA